MKSPSYNWPYTRKVRGKRSGGHFNVRYRAQLPATCSFREAGDGEPRPLAIGREALVTLLLDYQEAVRSMMD